MKYLTTLLAAFVLSTGVAYGADVPAPLTADQVRELVPLKHSLATVNDVAQAGLMQPELQKKATDRYLMLAASIAGRPVSAAELAALDESPQKLTALQKFAGFITWVNILWFAAIVIGVLSFAYLFGDLVRILMELFVMIPRFIYELIFYGLSGWLIMTADHYRPGVAHYVALTGCLMLAGALAFSLSRVREPSQGAGFVYFGILTGVYAAVALMYTSSMIGFITVIALMAALGFFALVGPLCVVIGFNDDDAVGRGTLAAFLILGAFTVAHVREAAFLPVFRTGALWMGSFVGFLGLLIASSRWYRNRFPYVLMQVVTIAAGMAALFIGSVYQIPELQRIGGTFFALYLLEKLAEIPVGSMRGYAVLGLVISGGLYWFCMNVKSNPEFYRPYLLF